MKTVEDRFFDKVNKTDTCWLWTGYKLQCDYGFFYGQFHYNKKTELSHRVSWRLFVGDIPKDKFVLHKCDVPLCVNPDHLFIGTQKDNVHDCILKQRARKSGSGQTKKTHCNNGHEYSGDNLRVHIVNGAKVRKCITCLKKWGAMYRQRRKQNE